MIRNIWAVGKNYQNHAKEMGGEAPKSPLFFLKAGSCAVENSETIELPAWAKDVHHEVELVLKFGSDLKISHFGLALDLTERTIQSEMKSKGNPWTLAKSFINSCPLTTFLPLNNIKDLESLELKLWVNDSLKQNGNTKDMIFKVNQLVDFALKHFPVVPGDLLLTGTPEGVGPIKKGDKIKTHLSNLIEHNWLVK